MAEKKYIFIDHKGLRMVMVPMGKKDTVGNKIPGKTIEFSPDPVTREAHFITSDEKVQKFIEGNERFKQGKIFIETAQGEGPQRSQPDAEPGQSQDGLKHEVPAQEPSAPAAGGRKGRGARSK